MPCGRTPIYLAVRYGHIDIIKLLKTVVENINEPLPNNGNGFPYNGWTPIEVATRFEQTEIVKFLEQCKLS